MSNGASRPSTAEAAIEALLEGNARHVEGRHVAANPPAARSTLALGQAPFAAVIRCADSRVAPEIVFDRSLGDLFVTGVAGNVVTDEIIASLEYAVAALNCPAIVVMGHSSCGAVTAAVEASIGASPLPGQLPGLISQISMPDDFDAHGTGAIDHAIEHNANTGVDALQARSTLLAEACNDGRLAIIAGVLDLATGEFAITRR
ncbi:MAG: hypothetical protein MK101_02800 [Phycisphaerales bacterium]|nr:hypothetical protein [Phycisphaerales bacterium]